MTLIGAENECKGGRLVVEGYRPHRCPFPASCLATPGTQIWTLDAALGKVAESVGILARFA